MTPDQWILLIGGVATPIASILIARWTVQKERKAQAEGTRVAFEATYSRMQEDMQKHSNFLNQELDIARAELVQERIDCTNEKAELRGRIATLTALLTEERERRDFER
jgi:hypothetical protein